MTIPVALVIDTQGGDQQMANLTSLLDTIDKSDFPKLHLTIIIHNNGWGTSEEDKHSRLSGIKYAIQLGCQYVVYADSDVVPPVDWWSKMKEVFDADEKIGCVCVNVSGRYEGYNSSDKPNELYTELPYPKHIWEGFTGVRAEFWNDCHDWNRPQTKWKRVLANRLTVIHVPQKQPDRYTVIYYRG